jgi:hypothetical protein
MIRVPRRFATSRSPSAGLATGQFATLGTPPEDQEQREKREKKERDEGEHPRHEEGSHGDTQSARKPHHEEEG